MGAIPLAAAPEGDGQPFCFLHYDVQMNQLWLYSDTWGFFRGPVAPGTASSLLQGSHCALNSAASAASGSGGTLTLDLAVVFKADAARKVYLRAMDLDGPETRWLMRGTWTQAATPLGNFTVSPASGSGANPTFTLTYPDPPGFAG